MQNTAFGRLLCIEFNAPAHSARRPGGANGALGTPVQATSGSERKR